MATMTPIAPYEQVQLAPPQLLPPYAVIVFNDNDHTFDYVISVLQKIFKYSIERGYQLAEEIHIRGRAIVWTGSKEVAELRQEQIMNAGPDEFAHRAGKNVNYPLRVDIEPLHD